MPTKLVLHPGEEREFQLTGMGSVGYVWEWEVSANGIVDVSMQGEGSMEREAAGCSAPILLRVSGSKPGTAVLRLVLRRPFANQPPREQLAMEIEVAD
ncbi:MAG TPA: protease inhibitor I42 family protein [Burkholderiales bacterium]|nr:protease inhibitor I42 family protein [Burkholderiales bacterium]